MIEQQLQTHIVDYLEMETQTEKVECKNIRVQTPVPEIVDTEMQTDPIGRVRKYTLKKYHHIYFPFSFSSVFPFFYDNILPL